MKNLLLILSLLAIAFGASANKTNNKNISELNTAIEETKVEVYYFHFTRRCATCNAVENASIEALNEYFAKELKNGTIKFISVNLDEDSGKEIGKKLEVAAQKLLIVSGDSKADLTNFAFMNARSKPDKLKNKIKEEINKML